MRIFWAALLVVGCDSGSNMMMMNNGALTVTSTAFTNNGALPAKYGDDTCNTMGTNTSPPLAWSGAPSGTRGFAIVMEDLDFPLIHWVVWDIPATIASISENLGAYQQGGDWRAGMYGGPCPPPGEPHNYRFTVYAVNAAALGPAAGSSGQTVKDAAVAKKLAEGSITGKYTP
jgi:Raf kinase inhibitor-like YbhB/YbcL family protein